MPELAGGPEAVTFGRADYASVDGDQVVCARVHAGGRERRLARSRRRLRRLGRRVPRSTEDDERERRSERDAEGEGERENGVDGGDGEVDATRDDSKRDDGEGSGGSAVRGGNETEDERGR